jgi:Protein of unknown function (DUF2934)
MKVAENQLPCSLRLIAGHIGEEAVKMSSNPELPSQEREERIRAIAYAIWEEEGRPEGREQEHWLRACELCDADEDRAPEWLQRKTTVEQDTAVEHAEKPPLDEIVKRMKGGRAA